MKKGQSLNSKPMKKGQSMSTITPYQQSRVTNKSIDTRKMDSKVDQKSSRVSKAHSSIKLHQPLSIQQRGNLKQSNLQTSKTSKAAQPSSSQFPNSRKKIQSQLQSKNTYNAVQNPISFRQTETKPVSVVKNRDTRNFEETQRVESMGNIDGQLLVRENKQLREKVYRLQEGSLEDKEKIKTLISRISEMKRDNKMGQNNNNSSSIGGTMMMSKSKTTASYAHIMRTRCPPDRQNNPIQQTPFRILQPSTSQSKYSKSIQQKQQSCGNPHCEQRKKYLEGELYKERIRRDQLEDEKREWERNREQLKRQYQELLGEIQSLRSEEAEGEGEKE